MAQTKAESSIAASASEGLAQAKAAALSMSSTVSLAGSKLRKQMSGSLQESASAPTSDFAKKQLEKMGWKEGTGLGKKRDGITSHIKVVKRQDSAGLGTERQAIETQLASEDWWKSSLGDALARLGGKKKGIQKRERKDYTDEELFEATGGARFGMRAGKTRNLAKWKRAEGDTSAALSDAATRDEEKEQKEQEPPKKKKKKGEKSGSEEENAEEVETKKDKKDKKKSKKAKKGKEGRPK